MNSNPMNILAVFTIALAGCGDTAPAVDDHNSDGSFSADESGASCEVDLDSYSEQELDDARVLSVWLDSEGILEDALRIAHEAADLEGHPVLLTEVDLTVELGDLPSIDQMKVEMESALDEDGNPAIEPVIDCGYYFTGNITYWCRWPTYAFYGQYCSACFGCFSVAIGSCS